MGSCNSARSWASSSCRRVKSAPTMSRPSPRVVQLQRLETCPPAMTSDVPDVRVPKWLPHIKFSNMFLKCSCGYQIRPCTDEHSQNGMMFSAAGNGFIFFCPHLMVAVPKKTRSFRNGASLSNCTASGTPNRDQNSQKT